MTDMTDENNSYYRASLCMMSETLKAEEITNILKTQPSEAHEKGTPINPRHPNRLIRTASTWVLCTNLDESEPFQAHIEQLLSFIEARKNEFEDISKVSKIEIYCSFFSERKSGEFFIDYELLKRLTIIPIDITVILYPPDFSLG